MKKTSKMENVLNAMGLVFLWVITLLNQKTLIIPLAGSIIL